MLPFALAAGLALVHVSAGRLRSLDVAPRNWGLSVAGGISVAYVFMHLLPEVASGQEALAASGLAGPLLSESHVWALALAGLVAFYGLDRAAETSRAENADDDQTEPGVFWLHMVSYGLYNAVVGYLLTQGEDGTRMELLLFWVAMAVHFVVNDAALRGHHKEPYRRVGRWVLAAAVLGGTGLGLWRAFPEAVVAGLIAALSGGIVLNVLKEELPDECASRFWPFAAGAAAYAALLMAF